jgi:CHAT domain-containing protein/Tfp pilus assembly protein PilF
MSSAQTSTVETDLAKATKEWQTDLAQAQEAIKESRYADAEKLIKEALAVLKESAPLVARIGDRSEMIQAVAKYQAGFVTAWALLATAYDSEEKYAEADPLYERLVARSEHALSLKPEDPDFAADLARTLFMRAVHYRKARKPAEAEPLLRRSLTIIEKVGGPEANEIAASVNNELGTVCQDQGKYEEAESLFQRSLATTEQVFGPEHRFVATVLGNLAQLKKTEGKYADAEPLLERVLRIKEKALGPEHPEVAVWLNSLAAVYLAQGNYASAEPLAQRALRIAEKALGSEAPLVAVSLDNLAALYLKQGNYPNAEPLLQRALRIQEKALGPDDLDVALTLNSLAQLYVAQGNYRAAEPIALRTVHIREKDLGPEHPDVALVLSNLALLYQTQGNYPEAEPLLRHALHIQEKMLGPEHPMVAISLGNLAQLYLALGNYVAAEPLYQRALRIQEKALGSDHPDVATLLNGLGMLYDEQGNYAAAKPLYQRALRIQEKTLGPEHAYVATSLSNLAQLSMEQGNVANVEPLMQRALRIREKALGPDHPDVAISLNNLAQLYVAQENYAAAEPLLQRALRIQDKALGPGRPQEILVLVNLAVLFYALDLPEQAEPVFDRALRNQVSQFDYLFPYMTEKERLSFLGSTSELLPVYYSFCLKYGQGNPALLGKMYDAVLGQKEFVGRTIAAMRSKIAATNDKEALGLLDKLTAKRSQLAALFFAKPPNAQAKQSIDQLAQEANTIESELLKHSRALTDDKKLAAVAWQDVQRSLKAGEAAVELVKFPFADGARWTGKTHYVALIITAETKTAPVLIQLGEGTELEGTPLMKYRDMLSEPAGSAQADESMYRGLWKPMEEALGGAKTIYLSPDGVLNLVSYPVIPIGDGRRLLDKYDIRVISSTRDLLSETTAPAKSAVLIGDPRFELTEAEQRATAHPRTPAKAEAVSSPGGSGSNLRSQELREGYRLAALPATKLEIESIRSLLEKQGWKVETFTGAQATEEAIKSVQGPRVLHVATHAFFLKDQVSRASQTQLWLPPPAYEDPMLRSGLFLAGAARILHGEKPASDLDDGILTASEATGLNLQGTELVVLSACETGRGQVANGEGVFGLRRALHEAGARAVLMSLWSVPDRETQELMTLFYSKWLASGDKHQAFREAEMELRAKVKARYGEDRPFYWGGFVLVGR